MGENGNKAEIGLYIFVLGIITIICTKIMFDDLD